MSCHFESHVMAHESFEDDATAAVMNELFVNVKVDREERPRRRRHFRHGGGAGDERPRGWPGIYRVHPRRPPLRRHLLPEGRAQAGTSFTESCWRASTTWRTRRASTRGQSTSSPDAIGHLAKLGSSDDVPGPVQLDTAVERLRAQFDPEGRSGNALKFPQTMSLDLLRRAADEVVTTTPTPWRRAGP
ncbi:MAG: DUF255 domain-containing protein [Acidimicrobiales bacterium]